MVPSSVQATLTLTGTNAFRMDSGLELDSEDCVISHTLERTAPQEDSVASIVPTTKGRTETSERVSTSTSMSVRVVRWVEQRIERKQFGTGRTLFSAVSASVGHGAASSNYNGTGTGSVHPTQTKIIVERAKCVALKGGIGRPSAEFVVLVAYVGLLINSEQLVEQNCA